MLTEVNSSIWRSKSCDKWKALVKVLILGVFTIVCVAEFWNLRTHKISGQLHQVKPIITLTTIEALSSWNLQWVWFLNCWQCWLYTTVMAIVGGKLFFFAFQLHFTICNYMYYTWFSLISRTCIEGATSHLLWESNLTPSSDLVQLMWAHCNDWCKGKENRSSRKAVK